ncbi:hypothetical protein PC129_g3044 [Phytophthora cactorum]|uniref:Uncharacterized protein n=1 Tax=Phytophthora cactorum TaxID=29920 RepID=A0A8T1IQ30_9STRA|nr:hypothetical protein PC129_g3044 [Phytophthora cactorum]
MLVFIYPSMDDKGSQQISALSISGVPPTQDTRRHVKRQDVASLSLGVVEDARRIRMSEETPTSTRIWAQTECWRISSSPPASVCMVVALWTVADEKLVHIKLKYDRDANVNVLYSISRRTLINSFTEIAKERQATPLMPEPTPGVQYEFFAD